MLHRLAVEESETDTTGTQTPMSSESDVPPLDFNDKSSSMSSVYGNEPPPRPLSPSSTSSSHHSRKHSFPFHIRRGSGSSADAEKKKKEKEDGLSRWLRDGTVVFKSVGLGLMDLVVGNHLIKVAREKNIGTQLDEF